MNEARSSRYRRSYVVLIVLALIYLAAELELNPTNRFFDYDEAIYISQSAPTMQPAHWAAHRARGIAWLLEPVAGYGASLQTIRIYLMLLSALLFLCGFALWISIIGEAAPLAAWIFGGTWLALFYGAEAMPNHFTALFVVITVAATLRAGSSRFGGWSFVAGLAMTATALLRPTDASCVLLGILAWQWMARRKLAWRRLLPPAAGVAVGWAQWLWEAETLFGGIAERFRQAGRLAGGLGVTVLDHLRAADGPLLGGDRDISTGALLWWIGLVAASIYGATRTSNRRSAAAAALSAGLASTFTYFFLTRSQQVGTWAPVISPRFLSPAYALLSIPAATGCILLVRAGHRYGRVVAACSIAGLLLAGGAWQVWQWNVAERIARREFRFRESNRLAAAAIRKLRDGRDCLLISQFPEPQIRYSAGCDQALRKPYVFRRAGGLRDLARPDLQRFALVYPPPFPDQALALRGWRVIRPEGTRNILLFAEPEPSASSGSEPLESRPETVPPANDLPSPPDGH